MSLRLKEAIKKAQSLEDCASDVLVGKSSKTIDKSIPHKNQNIIKKELIEKLLSDIVSPAMLKYTTDAR
ncbi:hypothetical protein NitYY0826_C1525 [Nitratiruptor sp. YY08-26]|uniref:hypothetical protein n=1 Tax=unclassified Nitratiruptor TaxID=2624044 RepID=UPI0019159CDC|nr:MULTISPECIES: hypothetical protein [unclassified Nitratiruptor]BCD62643.1 hypothetical protein NitYY0813_C1523 [Nitratiruptor sp. YY08-13]BCD66579.1 hypothetical protein NitYY0826_C1525 [Nitratiruptor sp. YY08-26]